MRAIHLVGGLCLAHMALPTPVLAQHLAATQVVSPPTGHAQRLVDALNHLEPATQVAGRTYPPQSIEQMMARYKVPAVSLAVVNDGRVVWAKAYGKADPAPARSANPGTLFQAASISKPVAAMGALSLVEAGKLQLDSPANRSLISWRIADTDVAPGDAITLRHLLTLTAGLTVHGFPGYAEGKSLPTTLQVLDGAAPANTDPVRITKAPGSEWKYSGGGYTVLEQPMEDVTGEPFPQLMHRLVFKPAGMLSSSYGAALPSHANNLAVGHLGDGTPVVGRHHSYAELAAAGLWTNPTDLASWLIDLSAAFRGAEGQVLEPALARSMLTPGRGDWGLGLPVRGKGDALNFSHGGANEGFRAAARSSSCLS